MDMYNQHGFILRDFVDDNAPDDGDEIVFTDPVSNSNFHMERMSEDVVWFCITARDPKTGKERQLHINLIALMQNGEPVVKMAIQELPDTEWDTPEVQKQSTPT